MVYWLVCQPRLYKIWVHSDPHSVMTLLPDLGPALTSLEEGWGKKIKCHGHVVDFPQSSSFTGLKITPWFTTRTQTEENRITLVRNIILKDRLDRHLSRMLFTNPQNCVSYLSNTGTTKVGLFFVFCFLGGGNLQYLWQLTQESGLGLPTFKLFP